MRKIGLISLGCPRNLVDSEVILGSLKKNGFKVCEIEEGVDVCLVNTCAFTRSARDESIDTILEASQLKKEGKIAKLIVCGCLAQLYGEKLLRQIPEIDAIFGSSDFPKISEWVKKNYSDVSSGRSIVSRSLNYLYNDRSPRYLLTPSHYAYIKISEGCSNLCSYCIIGRLRGKSRSRTIDSVVEEAGTLSKEGLLKEINLIGQDTTLFGVDIYGRSQLAGLLRRLARSKGSVRWIRLLYTHPAHYTDELISTIRGEEKVCKYLDLPIQHISDKILKDMNRRTTAKDIKNLIEKLKNTVPGIALRTSIIVGFPGETEKDFRQLEDFVRQTRFERLGAFVYSREDGTRAAKFARQIPEKTKHERLDAIMRLQQGISAGLNRSFLGHTVTVLIDEEAEDGKFLGRTQFDAPEVDGIVYVSGSGIKVGSFYKVNITDTLEYDLVGEKV